MCCLHHEYSVKVGQPAQRLCEFWIHTFLHSKKHTNNTELTASRRSWASAVIGDRRNAIRGDTGCEYTFSGANNTPRRPWLMRRSLLGTQSRTTREADRLIRASSLKSIMVMDVSPPSKTGLSMSVCLIVVIRRGNGRCRKSMSTRTAQS